MYPVVIWDLCGGLEQTTVAWAGTGTDQTGEAMDRVKGCGPNSRKARIVNRLEHAT